MPKCILWITASVLLMTTDYLCLQRDAFGMQEANTTARIGIPDSDWTSLTLQKPVELAEETAPGPLKTDRAASHLPVNQPWRKSPLHRQCPELKLSKQSSHTASNHFREVLQQEQLQQEHEASIPKRFTPNRYRWSIGSPGMNDYFLPLPCNQVVSPTSGRSFDRQQRRSNQLVNTPPTTLQGDRHTHQKRRERFEEIPQTLSPQVTPKLIQIQETKKNNRGMEMDQDSISSHQAPIVLRAIPQKRVFRQTSNTARLKINFPRHQERLSESDKSRSSKAKSDSPGTHPANIIFQKDQRHQRQQDTNQPDEPI